ncbi:MAG: hypothetical protein HYV07_34355 [Deltaproteobacteria bacterium]|nr:hypothetical protein [Deltaproteobacteria bacterium]
MHLDATDLEAFMRIWESVDRYLLRKTGSRGGPEKVDNLGALRARLREDPDLIESFLKDNPDGLSAEDLAEFEMYRYAVHDRFFVERSLKTGTIMVSGDKVYCVAGLRESVRDLVSRAVPVGYGGMVKTTLLPFRGRIVWDGLVQIYNVSFGPHMRNSYKEAYLRARDRGEIVTSLDPSAAVKKPTPPAGPSNWVANLGSISSLVKRFDKPRNPVEAAALKLLKSSLEVARASTDPSGASALADAIGSARKAHNHLVETTKRLK